MRNQPYLLVRQGKTVRFSSPTQFMAQRKSTIDEAYPGDIVGLPDNGVFKIGVFVSEGPFCAVFSREKGFSMCHVVFPTSHVRIFTSAYSENYMPCTPRQKCRKVKNVNVGIAATRHFRFLTRTVLTAGAHLRQPSRPAFIFR